mmetsp:Transcript_64611/g.131334  ORF Transcript_64611/g.131334 Transcript_64611/m.131334 type:complete len:96 (-) Transcript_64611:27-314(-)
MNIAHGCCCASNTAAKPARPRGRRYQQSYDDKLPRARYMVTLPTGDTTMAGVGSTVAQAELLHLDVHDGGSVGDTAQVLAHLDVDVALNAPGRSP